jgi:hypothetical protein
VSGILAALVVAGCGLALRALFLAMPVDRGPSPFEQAAAEPDPGQLRIPVLSRLETLLRSRHPEDPETRAELEQLVGDPDRLAEALR